MALKVITPGQNTGYDSVGVDDYRAGQLAARAANGTIVVAGSASDPNAGDKVIGVLGEDRITTILQTTSQVLERAAATCGAAGADGPAVTLSHDAVVADSQRIVVAVTQGAVVAGTALVEGAAAGGDYLFTDATGVFTIHSGGPATLLDSTTYQLDVTYTFQLDDAYEKNFRGVNFKGSLDETEGSSKSTVWKGYGEYQTDQFDTNEAYAVGDLLQSTLAAHPMGAGLLALAGSASTSGTSVARVSKVPTASDPFLGFEFIPIVS